MAVSQPSSSQTSLHQILGGALAADVMLWKKKTVTISTLTAATAFWILFNFLGYSLLSLIANTLLLLVSIIFFWAKSATLLNRPLPPIPNLEISEQVVEKAADDARVWINYVLSVAREIGVGRNRNVLLQVIMGLWVVSFVGSLFSFYTIVYIVVVVALTVPALYDTYRDDVNEVVRVVRKAFWKNFDNALGRPGSRANKDKKIQ